MQESRNIVRRSKRTRTSSSDGPVHSSPNLSVPVGVLIPSQKERVDAILKRDPAVVAAESLIGRKGTDSYEFIRDPTTKEEKVGRFSPSQFPQQKFLNDYIGRDRAPVAKQHLEAEETDQTRYLARAQKDKGNEGLLAGGKGDVDTAVRAYADYICISHC